MKFSTTAVALFAAVAYGQSISDLPSCALSCFLGPLQSDGCKSLTDFKCHCSKPGLLPQVVPCVQKKCPANVAAQVGQKAVALCKANGVDITLPPTGGSPSTSAPAPGTTKSTGGSGGKPSTTEASATGTASTYCPPSTMSSIYPTGNGTTPTPYPQPPTSTGAAAKVTAMAGAAALALGAVAAAL